MTYSEAIQLRLRDAQRQFVDPEQLAEAHRVVAAARATRSLSPAARSASVFNAQYVAPATPPTPAPRAPAKRVEPGPRIGNEPRQSWIWSVDTHQAQQFAEHKPVVLVLQPVLAIDFYPRGA